MESKRQHGGKAGRFEAAGRNGGIAVDSSEEKFGLEDFAGNGVGGVVELEDRIMSGDCGTEDCIAGQEENLKIAAHPANCT